MIDIDLSKARRSRLGGAPEGYAALLIVRAAQAAGRPVLFVARDEERMVRLREAAAFFAPDLPTTGFSAWDCLPYDRVSPNGEVVSRRIETLSQLAARAARGDHGPLLVVTTVNAVVQRVAPREMFRAAHFAVKMGDRLDLDALTAFLGRNGYARTETVMEPGEFAVRGGIVDIFPPGSAEPVRLDLFGDEVDGIRSFDALTQKTTAKRDGFELMPVSEILLDEASIQRFRTGYRALFGAVAGNDPLYESISAGRRHPGMEHWLALFHDELETLFDYLPDAPVILDEQAAEARDARLDMIADHYGARRSMMGSDSGDGVYRPAPPEGLYLDKAEWEERIASRPVLELSSAVSGEAGVADAGGRPAPDFSEARADPKANVFTAAVKRAVAEAASGQRVLVTAYTAGSRDRLANLLREHGLENLHPAQTWPEVQALPAAATALAVLDLDHGTRAPGLTILTEQDILGERLGRRPRSRRRAERFLTELSEISEGDLVVHIDHGIGRYEGLETIDAGGAPHDCLRVVYAGNDKLFVPVENIEVLSRYGSEESSVQLDKLGGAQWQARKAKLKQRIRDMADQLIAVAAQRQVRTGETLTPPEGLWDEFCARFPYPETDDQMKAIEDVVDDFASGRPMDRLVCGDVGFGKTEVALRAAFLAAMAGLQVAVVVPTTLLARQHYKTFSERFAGLPIRVEQLSRMVSAKDATKVKKGVADGTVDIVVGTHALIAKSIQFKNLGLLIVDEEQHFGVSHKERLKQMRADVHVLTLTATPIPRTLQLALSGVREMSIIATPPVDRLAVRTFVGPFDPLIVREAITRERFRGGQIFYVCPRVRDLAEVVEEIKKLVPDVKIAVAHGGLAPSELEAVMSGFYEHSFDILVSTNIVESGLDIPTANTLIVHRADMFGLAQLYQLRGRIGRGKVRAYAYLTLPPKRQVTKAAEKRLHVMQTLDALGAGFTLASYDLDIRGAGNLLGDEQSGHIREVGIELYQQMLEEAVTQAREGDLAAEKEDVWSPQINIGSSVLIPDAYVTDLSVRLGLYRRVASLEDRREIDAFAAEMVDRFGPLPPEVENLLEIVAIKRLCRIAGVEKIDAGPKGTVVSFRGSRFANPGGLIDFITRQAGTAKLRPDHRLVYQRAWEDAKQRLKGVKKLLQALASIAKAAEAEPPRRKAAS
ncbi:transcription-repair coupling factor (superfamily II helicase) [Constrictibacter sp. MBR-5]|uniref:transcription-repair coupling factor n=1 Tax=Constrictibacter sp. MBR-5 TaxID=3156467 RepID=UPI003398AA63